MKFYSMKNRFSGTFNTPFPASNHAEAIYQIRMVINQKREPEIIAEDFGLYFVGEFLHEEGVFSTQANIACPVCLFDDCSVLRVKKDVRVKKDGGDDA